MEVIYKDSESNTLELTTAKDQDLPGGGELMMLGVDIREHAYHVQWFEVKTDSSKTVCEVVNWKAAEKRIQSDRRALYGSLAGLESLL